MLPLRALIISVLPCLISAAVVSSSNSENEISRTARKEDSPDSITKMLQHCLSQEYSEMGYCFGIKAVAIAERASRMNHINLFPGVTLVGDTEEIQQRSARALMTEEEIENTISVNPNEKMSKLTNMFLVTVANFIKTHSLQLRMPKTTSEELQRAFEEGRAKIKRKFWPYLGIIAVKIFALLPLLLGFVGFVALKALLVGTVALIVAGILAFQKYSYGGFSSFGKQSDGYTNSASSYYPVSSPGGYYRRSVEEQAASQNLAYSAQIPSQSSHS